MQQSARKTNPAGRGPRRQPPVAEMQARIDALEAELRETRDQQTATAEVLGVINSSPGDLAPVFDVILEKAHSLCDAPCGSLQILDGEQFRAVATRGISEAYAAILRQGVRSRVPDPNAIVQFDFAERLAQDPGNQNARVAVEIEKLRTVLLVPLLKDNVLIGRIAAGRQEARPFTDKQIALLQNFAAQAVIAMENARLITETREALEQQTAAAEVLGVINSSPGDLAPVFDAMLEKALRLCEASFGTLSRIEGENFYAVAVQGAPPEFAAAMRQPRRIVSGNAHYRLAQGEEVVQIEDVSAEDVYRSGNPARRLLVDVAGARTTLWVALRKDQTTLGAFVVYRREVRPFTEKQIALLQSFAAQAVIAMENARLITETREALEQQIATAEVLGVINSSPGDLAPVFDAILEKAHTLCGADHGNLTIYDGEYFRTIATHAMAEPFAALVRQPFRPQGTTFGERLLGGERLIHIPDLRAVPTGSLNAIGRAAIELGGIRTLLAVPLRKDHALLGYITAHRAEVRPFSDKQIALLQNFAAQAVIAIENARLITETREALEQQTATAEVLGVINSSPGDLAPVFDAILEKAHSLCDSGHGSLFLLEGEYFRAVAMRAVPEPLAERLRRGLRASDAVMGPQLLAGEPIVHIIDLAELDHPMTRLATESGVRTLVSVPLRKGDSLFGMIVAARFDVRPFTEKQIALLQNFAAQAVIAMENARLLGELRQRTEEVAELNRGLEARIAAQVEELGRVGRLKRFLAPQLAELIVSQGDEKILESHRREIVVVFCDLRGYTAFTETAEPEEVLDFLREYHGALGPLVSQFEGTLDQFSGDGIMVFFNDPVPIPDAAERAVKMAVAMREAAGTLIAAWRERGRELGFGAGAAQGYATLGQIGFSERSGYTAIGTVCNVAARLCGEAKDGQILLSQRVNVALRGSVATEQVGALALKGLTQPVIAYDVPLAGGQPILRVVEGGPSRD